LPASSDFIVRKLLRLWLPFKAEAFCGSFSVQTYTKNGDRGAIVSAVGMPWVSPSVAPS
jgi:hypothetical protein